MNTVRFTLAAAQAAAEEWNFNCGPASLCAVLDMTPAELRPHLLDFEKKGYTNPTLMASILRGLGVKFTRRFECVEILNHAHFPQWSGWPTFGLARIQWAGPWTKEGVPMAARYRKTHWIGVRRKLAVCDVFDVNALSRPAGPWMPLGEWRTVMVPHILTHCVPKANGEWWPTHCWEITR